jgi:hypothetical protein
LEPNPYEVGRASANPSATLPTCLLNLNSLPSAKVVLDGMPLGFTPRIGIRAPAGEHQVLFVGANGDRQVRVTCAKGETKTVAERLTESPPSDDLPEKNPYR